MSVLVHVCSACGHDHHRHQDTRAKLFDRCPCCNTATAEHIDPKPTVRETWSFETGELEPLYEPGSTRNGGNGHRTQTCGCRECKAAYARLTA